MVSFKKAATQNSDAKQKIKSIQDSLSLNEQKMLSIIHDTNYSEADLNELVLMISRDKYEYVLEQFGVEIIGAYSNIIDNNVVVELSKLDSNAISYLKKLSDHDVFDFQKVDKYQDEYRDSNYTEIYGGLRISATSDYSAGNCTNGFSLDTGYIVTAAHCPLSDDLTRVENTIYYQGGRQIGNYFAHRYGGQIDAALIRLNSSAKTSSKIYSTSYSTLPITSWQRSYQDYVGMPVRMSGAISGNTSGQILAINYAPNNWNGYSFYDLRRASYRSQPGDSGATIHYNNTLYGSHKGSNGTDAVYSHVHNIVDYFRMGAPLIQ